MQPKSLSATALNVFDLCPSRYEAEHILRGESMKGDAATLGSSVHGALENYVQMVHLNKTTGPDLKLLLDLFKMEYMKLFGTANTDTEEYKDGVAMLKDWFKRTKFDDITVLSVEIKENFPVKTSIGPIPLNFVWDRFDQTGDNEYRVVDYKTNRWGLRPQDLHKKIQARIYGLAAQIKHPNADSIWVEFDMLRHGGPVGTVFRKEDNVATWKFIKDSAERIINTPDGKAPETINPECNFCIRKVSCEALKKNNIVGGLLSLTAEQAVDHRAVLEYQKKAIESALKDLDKIILSEARERDIMEFESESNVLSIGVSSRRTIDAERAEMVIGPQLMSKYGGRSLTLASVDLLLKGDELTEQQKRQLGGLIYRSQGEPKVKIESKSAIGD